MRETPGVKSHMNLVIHRRFHDVEARQDLQSQTRWNESTRSDFQPGGTGFLPNTLHLCGMLDVMRKEWVVFSGQTPLPESSSGTQ